jgi:hypothetical protein
LPQPDECVVTRYAAYFRGWCQAFGEHDSVTDERTGISWLRSDNQVGLVLPEGLMRALNREVLLRDITPVLTVDPGAIHVGALEFPLGAVQDTFFLRDMHTLLESGRAPSLFLTSHFMYGTGTRIMTLSGNAPLALIYKPIGSLRVRFRQARRGSA